MAAILVIAISFALPQGVCVSKLFAKANCCLSHSKAKPAQPAEVAPCCAKHGVSQQRDDSGDTEPETQCVWSATDPYNLKNDQNLADWVNPALVLVAWLPAEQVLQLPGAVAPTSFEVSPEPSSLQRGSRILRI